MAETPMRFVRIEDDIWNKGKARAKREGTTMSAVLRDHAEEYANGDESMAREIGRIMVRLRRIRKRLTIGE